MTGQRLLQLGTGAIFLLAILSACTRTPSGSIVPSRWILRELIRVKGAVVCIDCSVEEARTKYPDMGDLYELKGPQEQVVMRVDWVSDAVRWRQIALSNRLWVRAADQALARLTAPEHLFQAMEISGLLRKERTLDIASVTVVG